MQSVRSTWGFMSKTWNSINPANLSGAIDVIVVEQEDGNLACSPFHVRFGKFSLLRPYEKKVEFRVNNEKQDLAMKLGEGGEAFFVFETAAAVPEDLQTSPLVSPIASPAARPITPLRDSSIPDVEPLDLDEGSRRLSPRRTVTSTTLAQPIPTLQPRPESDPTILSRSLPDVDLPSPLDYLGEDVSPSGFAYSGSERPVSQRSDGPHPSLPRMYSTPEDITHSRVELNASYRKSSPPPPSKQEAIHRALTLSKKLWSSNIPSKINDEGDLMLDMTGYKSNEEEHLRADALARQILSEELEGNYEIGSLIGADEHGNVWIYSSEEAKEAAARKAAFHMAAPSAIVSADALSDPGYQSEDTQSQKSVELRSHHERGGSDSAVGMSSPPDSPRKDLSSESSKNFAKTLRLSSDQLKALKLKPGANSMSFSVSNRAILEGAIYLWTHDTPIVISDIDGTITKSDALGHVLNMIGRDWTHLGVAKLYSDIVANGYNILYLTSRSVGQADTTRRYIEGINQEGHKLPSGPVIMSPDRTIAALRREVYLRKPEVFKMACLRDIMSLFDKRKSPFYAGFGNRLTDALSYRSVNIPSTRIFTINSNAEVTLDLLSLNKFKTAYPLLRETVDHFFPPVSTLVQEGGEDFTDFNYWRDRPLDLDELPATDSDESESEESDDEDVLSDELADSRISQSRESLDESTSNLARLSIDSARQSGRQSEDYFGQAEGRHVRHSLQGRRRGSPLQEEDDSDDE